MDYNGNDYEGQNLHLAGEESSKISSVLRTFALPKFDFDDSIHGHLRFDSLVENEVFLGISSQGDNQWIEDFSRGSGGIGFSSSAAESCALPRHNNVWYEATSTESVEMLLKAVGQEEMVVDDSMIEGSDPGDQMGCSTVQMKINVRQDDKIDDIDSADPSISPAEVEGNFYILNQCAGIEGVQAESTLHAREGTSFSSEVCPGDKDSSVIVTHENVNIDMKSTNDNQWVTRDMVDDSLNERVQENLSVHGMEFDDIKRSSQKLVGESSDLDRVSDLSLVSSSGISEVIIEEIEEQKGFSSTSEILSVNAVEIVSSVMHVSFEVPLEMESSKEEHVVETHATNFKSLSMLEKGESVPTVDGCSELAVIVEPAGGSECGNVVSASTTGIEQLSEGYSMLHETPSLSLQGEVCTVEVGINGSVAVKSTICDNIELKQVLSQPSDQPKSPIGDEDICPRSRSFLEASHATLESSVLAEVLGNPSEQNIESNIDRADISNDSKDSSFAGECCGEESVTEDMKDLSGATRIQKENLEDGIHVSLPLVTGFTPTCGEDVRCTQVDAHDSGLDVSALKKEDKKLHLNMVCDDTEKEEGSSFSGEGVKENVERATESQLNASPGDYQVLNSKVEHAKPISSCVEADELVDTHEHNSTSFDVGYLDQDQKEESEVTKKPCNSISEKSLEVAAEVTPNIENEKGAVIDSAAAGGTKMGDQTVFLVETSNAIMPDKASDKLSENLKHPASDLIVQNDGSEAAPTEKPMEADMGICSRTNLSIVSASSGSVEVDESNQFSPLVICCTDHPKSQVNKKECLERNDVDNVGEVLPKSLKSGINELCKEEGTFTFDIRPLGGQSITDSDNVFQSFPRIQACKLSMTGENSPSSSQKDMILKEISIASSLMSSSGGPPSGGVKDPSERKTRRSSSKSVKETARKEKLVKETLSRQTKRGDKSPLSLSPVGAGQLMIFESAAKPSGSVFIPTTGLPDVNTMVPSSALYQQPFTDLLQVQLRAQIFVYGSLTQGTPPDEACMVSAFGMSDGGRSVWEPSWRACVERLHVPKNQGDHKEAPTQSRPGAKTPEQTSRHSFSLCEVLSSPAGLAGKKATPPPVVNPIIPLSSPLWNISTPLCEGLPSSSTARCAVFDYQAISPLHPYHTPPTVNFGAQPSSWSSQGPFLVPWHASSKSSPFGMSANYSSYPIMEPVKLTPVKELSLPTGATTMFAATSSPVDTKKVTVLTGQTSVDTKTRKRKKHSVAENVVHIPATASPVDTVSAPGVSNQLPKQVLAMKDLSQISLIARNQAHLMSTPVVSCHYSTSVAVASFMPKGTPNQHSSTVLPPISSDHLIKGKLSVDKSALNPDTFGKVEEAKFLAEEAAAHAATAVSHCQGVWNQLDQQRISGLPVDAEVKLASAAVAIAAAASVAKAAAAAAKIASTAAMQAKQMADEAVTKHGTVSTSEYDTTSVFNPLTNMANTTPVSIFKGGDRNNASPSVIPYAREAARKRVEVASAATMHAENLDAIVKAAELAAEAVSHAGKIVSMADPLSLNELVEAGPDGYWKISQVTFVPGSKKNDMNKNKYGNVGKLCNVFSNLYEGSDKDVHASGRVMPPTRKELSRNIVDDHLSEKESLITSITHTEKNLNPQKDNRVSDSVETASIVAEPQTESRSKSSFFNSYESTRGMKEGSMVEVLKDCGDLRKAWFSAKLLILKDGEAFVCYSELQSDEGSERLKEWVSLETPDGEAPIVRIPHPMTAVQFEGTRKRRRATAKDYAWAVGDKVDAWVEDCWREGIIAEKNEEDATALTVHFPAQGDTLIVKVWHLRPTVIWSGCQWIEWCRLEQSGTSQGDTPVLKRPKLGSIGTMEKRKGKMAANTNLLEAGRTEELSLPLSADEKAFNIGSTPVENKRNLAWTTRSGSQKEGSRVVFGVPKPGKKRKFMEVSKHYVSDRSAKINVPNDSAKLAEFLIPQGPGSRGRKNNSKLDLKEKRAPEYKPKVPKSGKPPSIPSRALPRKDDSSSSRHYASDPDLSDNTVNGTRSNDDNESGEQNLTEFGSFSNVDETSRGTLVVSTQALPPETRKKASTGKTKSERPNKGKPVLSSVKAAKAESNDKLVADPRRSNRRIKPTSRLLEGIQSSLIISKIPSSHDKSQRSHQKGSTRG